MMWYLYTGTGMHFDRSDLHQLTPEYISKLPAERLVALCEQLRQDLITARDRLNQNPSNSSRPSGSLAPWDRQSKNKDFDDDPDPTEIAANFDDPSTNSFDTGENEESESLSPDSTISEDQQTFDELQNESKLDRDKSAKDEKRKKRKRGRQLGSQGFGRTQKLLVTQEIYLKPECCKGCAKKFEADANFRATGGYCAIDILPPEPGKIGLSGTYTKYI